MNQREPEYGDDEDGSRDPEVPFKELEGIEIAVQGLILPAEEEAQEKN